MLTIEISPDGRGGWNVRASLKLSGMSWEAKNLSAAELRSFLGDIADASAKMTKAVTGRPEARS